MSVIFCLSISVAGVIALVECKNVAGRVIRSIHLYEGGPDGPGVSIDFEDGTNFTASLVSNHSLECKLTRDEGGEPLVLDKYEGPVRA
jgi:hypothetical protein